MAGDPKLSFRNVAGKQILHTDGGVLYAELHNRSFVTPTPTCSPDQHAAMHAEKAAAIFSLLMSERMRWAEKAHYCRSGGP
jgi:hypothetical protein